MKLICVYCGFNVGSKLVYIECVIVLGDCIVCDGLCLVYGGGNVGLMGIVVNVVFVVGGEVIGVILC